MFEETWMLPEIMYEKLSFQWQFSDKVSTLRICILCGKQLWQLYFYIIKSSASNYMLKRTWMLSKIIYMKLQFQWQFSDILPMLCITFSDIMCLPSSMTTLLFIISIENLTYHKIVIYFAIIVIFAKEILIYDYKIPLLFTKEMFYSQIIFSSDR